jgi:hypothetical protein
LGNNAGAALVADAVAERRLLRPVDRRHDRVRGGPAGVRGQSTVLV